MFNLHASSQNLLCAGVEIIQPLIRLENDGIFFNTTLLPQPKRISKWCDHEDFELKNVHPKYIFEINSEERKRKV